LSNSQVPQVSKVVGEKKSETTPKTSKQEAPQPTNTDRKQVTAGMATPNLIQQQT
jgi:hypothetical protein